MELIKHSTAVTNRPAPIQTGTPGWAARSSINGGTIITADMINGIIAELKNLIEGAGLSLNVNDDTLVKQAVEILSIPDGFVYDGNADTFTIQAAQFIATNSQFTNITGHSLILDTPSGNAGIELGKSAGGSATTPYIDFHSGTTGVDYDSRIVASGGTGVIGDGNLQIRVKSLSKFTDGVSNEIDAFPSGTRILFYQPTAPTGWTKVTLNNNYVIITGTGGTSGGNGSHDIATGCNVVASHIHSVNPAGFTATTSTDAHTHTTQDAYYVEAAATLGGINGTTVVARGSSGLGANGTDNDNNALLVRTVTSSSDSHNHTITINVPSTNTSANVGNVVWQPLYYTVIVAQKD
jgi:hypothetical protein